MEEGLEQVPGNDGMEVNFVDLMCEDGVVVFPAFLNTEQEVLDSVCVFEFIEA